MKKLIFLLFISITVSALSAQKYSPYIQGAESTKNISEVKELVKTSLEKNGFTVLGEYSPAEDRNRWIIIITSNELLNAAGTSGGLTGFAAALRVGITREGSKTNISYTNPEYWCTAYYRDDYNRVKSSIETVSVKLKKVSRESGTYTGRAYGSEDGITADDLKTYRYMMAMPRFYNTVELNSFSSFNEAVRSIDSKISRGVPDVKLVYSVVIPGKNLKLYGFALSGENGESKFLPIIDIGEPKHTAFLPYEILVMDNEVHMLHGRYRIALSFPDLTMGTFTKIMSTPGEIETLLRSVTE